MYTEAKDKTRQISPFNNNSVSAIMQTISKENRIYGKNDNSYMKHILGKLTTAEPIKRLPAFYNIGTSIIVLETVCKY
jgi:hypothetical protein